MASPLNSFSSDIVASILPATPVQTFRILLYSGRFPKSLLMFRMPIVKNTGCKLNILGLNKFEKYWVNKNFIAGLLRAYLML